jgi:type I restriction enzyme S subunit
MNKISVTTLGNLIEFQRGYDLPKSEFQNGIVPVISSNGVLGFHNIVKAKAPGITIGRSGTVGLPHYIEVDFFPHNTSLYIKDFRGNHPRYIYYLIKTLRLNDYKSGSGVPTMNRNHLHPIKVNAYLDIVDQQKIASVLSALDSKIELNNRINAELEAMAKTLYDYWFVQFDFPNAKGKPYKKSGGKMIYNVSVNREIPTGWYADSIEKCCSIIDCLHSKKSELTFENEKYYLLQLENIKDDGLLDLTNKFYVTKEEYKKWTSRIEVKENDIVITNAGRVAATAQIPKGVTAGIGRNITAIRPTSISPIFLFLSFRGPDLKRQIKSNTDSGAFFSSFNVKGIKKLFIVRPPIEIENKFEEMVKPIKEKRELNNLENHKLAELRDWLLPMLMNGQVKVG